MDDQYFWVSRSGVLDCAHEIDGNRPDTLPGVPTSVLPIPETRTVYLCVDGVLHDSDLPVQSFARHLTEVLPADRARSIIGGMRGFLEDKPDLIPAGVDLRSAEDGAQAVETLARAAGLTSNQIQAAHLASRVDLVATAWAVDVQDGLTDLLAALSGRARVAVLPESGDRAAAAAVLGALQIEVDEIVEQIAAGSDPALVLVVGARWTGRLAAADRAGCATALVDRFGRRRGTPTYRAANLTSLLDPVREWLQDGPNRRE